VSEHVVLVVRGMVLARYLCHNVWWVRRQLPVDFLHGVAVSRWWRRKDSGDERLWFVYLRTSWVSHSMGLLSRFLPTPQRRRLPEIHRNRQWVAYIPRWRGEAAGHKATSSGVVGPKKNERG